MNNDKQPLLNTISTQDWGLLEDFQRRVREHKGPFSEEVSDKGSDGAWEMTDSIEAPIVSEFRDLVYDKDLLVAFDWTTWDEGRRLLSDNSVDRFSTITAEQVF